MKQINVKRMEAKSKILDSKGKVFTLDFIKKNGEYRKMNARMGVTTHLKGGESPLRKNDNPYLVIVYDMQKKCYRTINLETAIEMRFGGIRYIIVD